VSAGLPANLPADTGCPFPHGIGADFVTALDPVELLIAAGMDPDPWQREVMNFEGPRLLLNICRQGGKSTTCAAKAVHRLIYEAGSLVLVASPSLRQSQEIIRKCREILHSLPRLPKIQDESALKIELANGSRLICLPGNASTVRGFSAASLVLIDEASRCDDDLFTALRPILATSGGQMICLSTPAGRRGFFFDCWTSAVQNWRRIRVTADQCPRISPAWLAEERETLGAWQFEQEFMCQFVEDQSALFSSQLIEAALSSEVRPLWQ
jgi:hypothetical protein